MNTSDTDGGSTPDRSPQSESICVDIVIEGPGDNTIRPLRPALVKYALAEQERLRRWQNANGSTGAPSDDGQ
jgi:hypothetical protein